MTAGRKLRPSLWPVSRTVLVACAGLCGAALAPHFAFANSGPQISGSLIRSTSLSDQESLIAFNIGRFRISDDMTAAPLNGSLCVDLQQLFSGLDFPILIDPETQKATGWYIRENQEISFDLKAGFAEVGGKRISIAGEDIGTLSTGSCLTIRALSQLFPLTFDYDANNSLLIAGSPQTLPMLERLQRQGRGGTGSLRLLQVAGSPRLQSLPYRAFVPPNTDVAITFGAHRAPLVRRTTNASWSTTSVGELAFMTAEAQLSGTEDGLNGEASRFRLYRMEREGGVFGISKLTEFGVGDISGIGSNLGATGGLGLGITASSFPTNRPTSFDRTDFVGDLPAGWDVELYRNGQLLEARNDNPTGGYAFRDVPVIFGDNSFDIVQYGPQGQRRVINRRINASNFLAAKGKVYFQGAVYRPEVAFGRTKPGSGVRIDIRSAFGVGDNLSLGGGFDSYMLAGKRLSIATLSAQTSLSGLAINSEISTTSNSRMAGLIEFQGGGNGYSLRGRLLMAQDGYASERIANGQFLRMELGMERSLNLSSRTSGNLISRVQFDRTHRGETSFTARQRLTLSRGNSWLAKSLSWSHSSSGERRDQIDGDISYSMRRGFQSVRASMDYSIYPKPRINRVSAVVERSFSVAEAPWRWRAETIYETKDNSFLYGVGAGRAFKALNLDFNAETDGRSTHKVGVTLSFALGRRSNGWGMTSNSLASNGTVRARIFEDMDEDGKFSDGDVAVAGAGIISNASPRMSVSNPQGYAVIDSVAANEPVQFNVITDDLADPNLFGRPTLTKPREGTVSEISIPLSTMGAIEGIVELVAGREGIASPLAGIGLVLLDSQQREIARTTSAYDGFYSFELVPSGAYKVEVAPDSALASRLRPVVPIEVKTTRAEPSSQSLSMTLIERNPTNTRLALRGLL